jgi:long-chain acyl-CoA synthetase
MSVYDEKPWLGVYGEAGLPENIESAHANALAMFRATVARLPEAPAIYYFDTTISWRQLDELSDALAVGLQANGFQPGDRVAAYLQNQPQFPLTMLAAWKAGGVMVSVNPMLKEREARTILADSGARFLVTLESLWRDVASGIVAETAVEKTITTADLDFLEGSPPEFLAGSTRDRDPEVLDLMELIGSGRGERPQAAEPSAGDVAFLTYTSGTTGPPKGAMNTHANVTFNSLTFAAWGDLDEDDVLLAIAPLFHITGLIAHVGASMLTGMPMVLFYRFDPELALEMIERHGVTFTVAAITAFIAMMHSPSCEGRDLSSLTKAVTGGAPVPPSTIAAFKAATGVDVYNSYGLTESTSATHIVPRGTSAPVEATSGALSVGVPVFNTMVRIRDDKDNDLAAGEVGEIVSKGPQVVAGYWEKPEETEHAIPGGELHTGDVGVMDDDGWFYIVDRAKDQINAAGYKVWPREVEDVVYMHEAVREAAVVGIPDEYRGETVKAFVSLKAGSSVSEAELISFCRERMAAYKYPRQVEFMDELPKTASGKLLRRELRDREAAKPRG